MQESLGFSCGAGCDDESCPWTCEACTFVNTNANGIGLACEVCAAPRDTPPSLPHTVSSSASDEVIPDDEARDTAVPKRKRTGDESSESEYEDENENENDSEDDDDEEDDDDASVNE